MHLLSSNTKQNSKNIDYPNIVKVKNKNQLLKAIATDHCASMMKDYQRNNKNWLLSDCLMVDVDNQNNAIPTTIEECLNTFRRYKAFIVPSKSHNKEKNGKIAQRFHVYFPIKSTKDPEHYQRMLKIIAARCKNDGDSLDLARYFNGIEGVEVYETKGKKLIDSAPFMKENPKEPGQLIKVLAPAGIGKSWLLRETAFNCTGRYKVLGPTWIASNNVRGVNYQRGAAALALKALKKTERRCRTDYFFIDEAGMIPKKFISDLQKCYPYSHVILFGDSVQFSFPGNALEIDCPTIILKNDINPRINDILLLNFATKLRHNDIDWSFINNRLIPRENIGDRLVISYTNEGCKATNQKDFYKGQTIRCKFNDPEKGLYNNELYKITDLNEWTTTIHKLEDNREITISTMSLNEQDEVDYQNEDGSNYHKVVKHWISGQANTCFSLQGKTIGQDIVIDLDSLNLLVKKGKHTGEIIVYEETLLTFLYTASTRVKTADKVFFTGKLTGSIIPGTILDLIKPDMESIEVNELIASIKKSDTVKSTVIEILKGVTFKNDVPFLGPIPGSLSLSDKSEVEDLLELIDYSEGHRNKALCTVIGQLKKKVAKGYIKDLKTAFDYANSIIGCEEAESIWNKYGDMK
ncbi:hypothetical protein AGMMS49587_06820 [Spirochaetia bacterium]|nr:hypothetical protein AGMMS49587_06820 [Spirochaetia bacterium]